MLNAIRYFFVSRETFCPGRLDSPNIPPNQMTLLAFSKMQPDNVHPTINVRQTLPIHFCTDLRIPLHIKPHRNTTLPKLLALYHVAKAGFVERMVPVILRKAPNTRKLRQTPSPDISPLFEGCLADFINHKQLLLT